MFFNIKDHKIWFSWEGFLNSYSQVFFSKNKVLGLLLVLMSFVDIGAGISGALSIFGSQLIALIFGFSREKITDGIYTCNSLLVGLAIGVFYKFNFSFIVLSVLSSIVTFFLTIWFSNEMMKKGLPFLSMPFLFTIWLVLLGAENFSALELSEKGAVSLSVSAPWLFNTIESWLNTLPFADIYHLYLKSLGAIFFQYNDLGGILIVLGLLYFSRIALLLSIYGFFIGYLFYYHLEGDFSQLVYSYIGFNFILSAIALGGFFIVPSKKSFLLLIVVIPMIAFLISGLHPLFTSLGLPMYSLPFNIVVLIILYSLPLRVKASGLYLVDVQQFSPELNHYKHHNRLDRFKKYTNYQVQLPFIGQWYISQGYNGGITHKGQYAEALDFDVRDEYHKTYKQPGMEVGDFYCYDLPVLAPGAGYVVKILDQIEDNEIGGVDLENNWGNTIVIKHSDYLYSKLSHIKKGSFKVVNGQYVEKGQLLANCGNSGRSPEPHLHFQFQTTPFIGSKTVAFPLTYYLSIDEENKHHFHSYEIPKESESVFNVTPISLLTEAFNMIPGKVLNFSCKMGDRREDVKWEIFTDVHNLTYIFCHNTKSVAYFKNDGTLFYFTDFYGKKKSLLHYFYFGAHRVLLGYYEDVILEDRLMIDGFFSRFIKSIHDFTAPFWHYCQVKYNFGFKSVDDPLNPKQLQFWSRINALVFSNNYRTINCDFKITKNKISKFSVLDGKNILIAECVD